MVKKNKNRSPATIKRLTLAVVCLAVGVTGAAMLLFSSADQPGISTQRLGINFVPTTVNGNFVPNDLGVASSHGIGAARTEAIAGGNIDTMVSTLAQANIRLYPVLGLGCPPGQAGCNEQASDTPANSAALMAAYVQSFARTYGPGGSFWSSHPRLPYLPVTRFEIGNEPNMPQQWLADSTHLHWPDPAAYAQVYTASRAALHSVDPSGVAVVGGLADSAGGGVDLASDEQWLASLPRGQVDAVGYHPYVFAVSDSLLETDTSSLHGWMNANGFAGVPIDVNEFGACGATLKPTNVPCPQSQVHSSAGWGATTAAYTHWALCTPGTGVYNVMSFWWGAIPGADSDIWLPQVDSELNLTPFGQTSLSMSQSLATQGCNPSVPKPTPTPTPPAVHPPTTNPKPGVTSPKSSSSSSTSSGGTTTNKTSGQSSVVRSSKSRPSYGASTTSDATVPVGQSAVASPSSIPTPSKNPVIAAVRSAKTHPVYYGSALSVFVLLAIVGTFWAFRMIHMGANLAAADIHLTPATAEPLPPEPTPQPTLPIANQQTPPPGTTVEPENKP